MMKRLLVLCAVLVPLSLFVAGCGDTGGGSSSSTSKVPAEDMKKMQENMKKNAETMHGMAPQPGGATPSAPAAK
ncbi:MAG: hypothetical protein ACLQNE_01425 [Thermoguttaceae bacterium]